MNSKIRKAVCVFIVLMMVTAILGACEKEDGDAAATEAASAKTTSAKTKTAAATSAAATAAKASGGETADIISSAGLPAATTGGEITGDTTEEAIEEPEDSEKDETPVAEEKQFDLKGREIKVIVSSMSLPVWPNPEAPTRIDKVKTQLLKEAEEKYNCKFVPELMVSWANLQQSLENAVMAGVYYCDVFRMTRAYAFPKYEQNNIIMPLNDFIDFEHPVYKEYDQINGLLYPDKYYAFYICGTLTPIGVFYNKEILSREGVQDIQQIDARGQWNWNTLVDIATKMTHDFNGDGLIDQWGIGADNVAAMSTAIMRSNLAAMVDKDTGGRFVYNLQDSRALKALQFVSDLYHTYKVIPNKSVLTDFRNGKAAMYVKDAWFGLNLKKYGLTNIGWEIIPYGPDNPGNMYMREQGSHMFFFPSNLVDPEPVVLATAWWNVAWDSSKSDYLTIEDIETSNAMSYFDSEENIDNFLNIIKTHRITYDYVEYFETTGKARSIMTTNVFNKIGANSYAPMSDIESIKLQVQEVINSTMGY
ncbi:MAG: extracellular solute-binding protein [Eubacteriales bacterium]|nr:extracellular solute-binding protein [Eubacteriales bacterium]